MQLARPVLQPSGSEAERSEEAPGRALPPQPPPGYAAGASGARCRPSVEERSDELHDSLSPAAELSAPSPERLAGPREPEQHGEHGDRGHDGD